MEKQVRAGKTEKILLGTATLFLCGLLWLSGQRQEPPVLPDCAAVPELPVAQETFVPEAGPVDLNRADAEELDTLPGIGPALARRIVEYREAHGPFEAVEELLEVAGIGESKLEELAGEVTLDGKE